jgi:uncharacterized membrane protein YbhN (UPF0104 family)
LSRIARVLASIGFLALAVYLLDWEQLASTLKSIDAATFVFAVLLTVVIFPVLALRWYFIVSPQAPLPMLAHLRHYLYASFLNAFTPANLGGDVYRVAALRGDAGGALPVVAAVVHERYVGVLVYLLTYLVSLPFAWGEASPAARGWSGPLAVAAACCAIAVVALAGPARLAVKRFGWGEHIKAALQFRSRREAALLIGISALGVALWISAVHFVSSRLGVNLGWAAIGAIAVLAELIRMVPLTIQGVGLREGAFALLFPMFGQSAEEGFIVGAISYLALSCGLIVVGLLASMLPAYRA